MDTKEVFVNLMGQFLDELAQTFPEVPKLQTYQGQFAIIKNTDPDLIVKRFMESMKPYQERIQQRDETLFSEVDNKFLVAIDAKNLWNSDISDGTRNAIWEYINQLYVLGSTISAVPNELLSSIENVAMQMQKTMESNPEALNDLLGSVMGNQDMSAVLGNLLKK